MSAFWNYFADTLRLPLIHAPGALQILTRGLAAHLDATRTDALYLREQFFPAKAEDAILPGHGDSRGITRHPKETDAYFRARVVHAYRWHLLGGKTEGLPQILKAYGFDVAHVENMREHSPSRWAEFQLGFKSPATQADQQAILDNLHELIWLVNEYKPARSFFFRLYNESFDKRPIVLSVGPKLGEGWLSFFSGVPVEDMGNQGKDTIVSFGMRHGWQAGQMYPDALCASFGSTIHLCFLAPYLDRFVVGRSKLSEVYPRNHGFFMGNLYSILWADRATTGRRWRGEWDARRWLDYTGFDRKLPPWRMGRRATSRSQLVPSWGEGLGDCNARLGATFATVIDNPMHLGEAKLSAHDSGRRELRLHEMVVEAQSYVTPSVDPGIPQVAGAVRRSVSFLLPYPERGETARHDAFSGQVEQRLSPSPRAAQTGSLATASVNVVPEAAPPAGVTSFRAPLWVGAWNKPNRTWTTPQEIATQ